MDYSLSLSEAAKAGGLSVSTLRRWCSHGRVNALKDAEGNWRLNESSLRAQVTSMKQVEKNSRTVQGATVVQNPPLEGLLKDTLERIVEPLRKALERETARADEMMQLAEEARLRIRELETKLDERDTRINHIQEQRIEDIKKSALSIDLLKSLANKIDDSIRPTTLTETASDIARSFFQAKKR